VVVEDGWGMKKLVFWEKCVYILETARIRQKVTADD